MSEEERRALHKTLGERIGVKEAGWLMDYLPPAGWSDLAGLRSLTSPATGGCGRRSGRRGE